MFYRFAWTVCRTFLLVIRRMEVRGVENVPLQGGLVVACNHKSYWDPVIVGCVLPRARKVHFMAKAELFKFYPLGIIITSLGTFPVQRGGADRSAIRKSLDYLTAGEVVGIFPEGTRNKSEGMLNPHLGAAMLATRARVPVLPVAIMGSRGVWGKVRVVIGQPIALEQDAGGGNNKTGTGSPARSNKKDYTRISAMIMDRVAALMKE